MRILTCLCSTCYVQGLGKAVMYCGDGINDLAALAIADVGMAISSSNAAAAATVCDRHASVAGASRSCTQGQSPFDLWYCLAKSCQELDFTCQRLACRGYSYNAVNNTSIALPADAYFLAMSCTYLKSL